MTKLFFLLLFQDRLCQVYPTGEKENHLQKCLGMGFANFQEGYFKTCLFKTKWPGNW